ncbi:MAG: cyclase family protein [Promethearchaeota archaeon]
MKIFDVSREIKKGLLVYPGDAEFKSDWSEKIGENEGEWNISFFRMSSHGGTHIDSPFHKFKEGKKISEFNISAFIGAGLLLDFSDKEFGSSLTKDDLIAKLNEINGPIRDLKFKKGMNKSDEEIKGEHENPPKLKNYILIIKTKNSELVQDKFREDYIGIDESFAELLVNLGVKAVAIDYLSIGNERVHEILLENNILIYENLDLSDVMEEGIYTFIGLPLRIDLEASPARVILMKD